MVLNNTAENIKTTIISILDKWSITNKFISLVTDNANTMIATFKLI